MLLDLYGTNHHPDLWPEPARFRPERFAGWRDDPFGLVPQGGGDHFTGHRCAGEWITIELMKRAVTNLTGAMSYRVPPQDLALDLGAMPALPPGGLVLDGYARPTAHARPVGYARCAEPGQAGSTSPAAISGCATRHSPPETVSAAAFRASRATRHEGRRHDPTDRRAATRRGHGVRAGPAADGVRPAAARPDDGGLDELTGTCGS
ncbi:hypothetical protein V2I01_05100 [Micromonospora sp. BRA006-A]|nr:hypothetical protein [Micromonospora sp. BRA006-A]